MIDYNRDQRWERPDEPLHGWLDICDIEFIVSNIRNITSEGKSGFGGVSVVQCLWIESSRYLDAVQVKSNEQCH